jgi:hypothetical protein
VVAGVADIAGLLLSRVKMLRRDIRRNNYFAEL